MAKFVTLHDLYGREVYVQPNDVSLIRTPGPGAHERAMSDMLINGQSAFVQEHPLEVKRILEHGA
jgi:hypothetical protein